MIKQNEPILPRPLYMQSLNRFRDKHIIKVLCGVRRAGKSTVLDLYKDELLSLGLLDAQVITRRYTSMELPDNFTGRDMYEDLKGAVDTAGRKCYLLLDEVQEVEGWEKAVNSIFESCDADIYVTGSNSKLLSSEISTYLSGRFVQIPVFTLSFGEYIEVQKAAGRSESDSVEAMLSDYIRTGAFPLISLSLYSQEDAYQIVDGIYATVLTKDIARRHNISNIDMFNRVTRFVCDNIGKTFSAKSVFDFFKSQQRSVAIETIYNYLAWLEEAFIIYRCSRYDLQGKGVLKTQEKFYLSDVSFKYSQLGFNTKMVASVLENIVYLELRRHGYEVYVGKFGEQEIDFVAERHGEKLYVQVCRNLPEDDAREIENLKAIQDNYPKYVVTLDDLATGNVDGIKIVHLKDFLLGKLW
ncbi:MAG: ATP-binding protein [Treponema sp.]|nr:ATP-binding protein [Treponema sp.]